MKYCGIKEVDAVHLVTPDSAVRRTDGGRAGFRKALCLHRADGDIPGGSGADYRRGEKKREKIYDDGNHALYKAVLLCQADAGKRGIR